MGLEILYEIKAGKDFNKPDFKGETHSISNKDFNDKQYGRAWSFSESVFNAVDTNEFLPQGMGQGGISFTRPMDRDTPFFKEAARRGSQLESIKFHFFEVYPGKDEHQLYFTITLKRCYITSSSISADGSGGGGAHAESIALVYQEIEWKDETKEKMISTYVAQQAHKLRGK